MRYPMDKRITILQNLGPIDTEEVVNAYRPALQTAASRVTPIDNFIRTVYLRLPEGRARDDFGW